MSKLKVIFFGTPEFAKASLEAIYNSKHQVLAVVTAVDKTSGRGQKINQSEVKKYALEKQIPIFQPEKLKNNEFLDSIKNLNADVFVVVAFRMMPKILFEIPKLGTFNLHASLLPDYRGAAPINYAIINGETKTGVTTFFINEKIDEGHILLQEEIEISPVENAGNLHDRLMELGSKVVVKTLDALAENKIVEKEQPKKEHLKGAYKIFKEDTKIDWDKDGNSLYNFIRGLSPYPSAFTTLKINDQEKQLKILKGHFQNSNHNQKSGSIEISKQNFKIFVKDGIYYPEEVQLEGKKMMSIRDFLNGFQNFDNIQII